MSQGYIENTKYYALEKMVFSVIYGIYEMLLTRKKQLSTL